MGGVLKLLTLVKPGNTPDLGSQPGPGGGFSERHPCSPPAGAISEATRSFQSHSHARLLPHESRSGGQEAGTRAGSEEVGRKVRPETPGRRTQPLKPSTETVG